ncbi:MAG: hypothetical protein JST92_09850, partial [Deltaproteobacteria bacterium]|nr:hypothetical protein [Deltaproteobacteria bacterium]
TFFAGDPALGNPEVRLQKDAGGGTYSDVLINGWIPVSSLRGEIPLFYSASPTFKAQPQASQRSHTWTAQYEPPIDLPAGNYRLHLVGRAQVSGSAQSIVLDTAPFTVGAATIGFQSKLAVASGTLSIDLLPLYPARTPTYAPEPNGDWQLDGFRLTDARYVAPFAPVEPGTAAVAATLTGPNGPQTISLAPQGTTYPSGDHFAPGDGPGLRGTSTVVTGHYTLTVAAGAFVDKNGNANGAFTAEVDAP